MKLQLIGRRAVLAGVGGFLASPAVLRAQGQNGVALVIGNAKYKWEASLPNVKRDAPDVAKRFQALGLKTELVQDAGLNAMRAAVDRFTAAARGANLAAFYYAGHGASWNKDTYLVPEDADLSNPGTVQGLQPVSAISAAVKEAQHRLLVFDNCRNNPADGWRQRDALIQAKIDSTDSVAAGLHAPSTLLLYSTSSGRTALDGAAGENSPFAAAFLRQLGGATVDIQALPANLRRDLLIATQGRQLLWDQNTYSEPFVLSELSNRPPASPRETPATSLGPGGYQARIVEVPNAYASARENKLPLPPGLLCCRPPDGSPHSEKIGAFKWPLKVRGAVFPTVGIIMSVSENTAEAVVSTYTEIGGWGVRWRLVTCALKENRLEFLSVNEAQLSQITWRDRNSGDYSQAIHGASSNSSFSGRFTRLDG